ncbi:L-type lectin-domain containing receptor kinase IX.1-like [Henckelia pumila]|uniref:L-type lectin-domain containing receptor kinase IX.1-like n=1 Tax=Henckelia pumila TaxID=405737 RepID=UPI003C6DF7E6
MHSISTIEIFSVFFFLVSIPATRSVSLSFNLSSFGSYENYRSINTNGDAYFSPQGIQLTPSEFNVSQIARVGRATYIEPLHLWDKNSGNLADFSTRFSFVIDSSGSPDFGDGITFFFAPVYSTIKLSTAHGASIGLNTDNGYANSSAETFFAVEFDTYQNSFDPSIPHVGIDVNSMVSVTSANWHNDITQGRENEAWISYSGRSKILSVNFTNIFNNVTSQGSLSFEIDLRDYMPEKVLFGFSGATGSYFERHTIKSWVFSSNLNLDITPKELPINPAIPKKKGLVFGLGIGLPTLILVLGFVVWFLNKFKKKRRCTKSDLDNEFERGAGAKKFSYIELANGTNDFAEGSKLGEGGFGKVYKGVLKGTQVAVKRLSSGSDQGVTEYESEVRIISQLRHRNLVKLIGWCHEIKDELLLVYDFLPNGSLDSHLFRRNSVVLAWEVRYKIAQGLASALLYLHQGWDQCVLHRDIKSSNIMLDSNFDAKLGDFGLARLVDHDKGSRTTLPAGTIGYRAPEYLVSCRASKESDVYSFGVVLLEITCGRKAIDGRFQENVLVEWVWKLYGAGKILEAADQSSRILKQNREEMERLLVVGLWCAHPDNQHRPKIREAMNAMNPEAELPHNLPQVMATRRYLTSYSNMVTSSGVNYNSSGRGTLRYN